MHYKTMGCPLFTYHTDLVGGSFVSVIKAVDKRSVLFARTLPPPHCIKQGVKYKADNLAQVKHPSTVVYQSHVTTT